MALAIKDVFNTGRAGTAPTVAIRIFDITADASYPTGGYLLNPADFGLTSIVAVDAPPSTDGAVLVFNPTTGKLMYFWSNASGSKFLEITAGTNLTASVSRAIIIGR